VKLYFDTAYIAKCYLNEPDGAQVRALAKSAAGLFSSAWSIAELACVFHRQLREGAATPRQMQQIRAAFAQDIQDRVWLLLPVTPAVLSDVQASVARLPRTVYVRAGDAIHLATAREAGFSEVWTNDRHLLAAAPHFHLQGRSV
jgi:predicted nucleic acid-binding protein